MSRRLVLASLWMAAVATLGAQDLPSFRTATDLVSIFATVTDRTGRLVTDLTERDFEVRDNGRRQPLSLFSNELQPFSAVVMIDRSGSMASHFATVAEAAATFVNHLMPTDRLRIGSFSDNIVLSPETFTSDREVLLGILRDRLQDVGGSPVWAAINQSIGAVSREPGRRVVLVFTDGEDSTTNGSRTALEHLVERAKERDVMVYAIGFSVMERVRAPVTPSSPGRRPPPVVMPRPPWSGPGGNPLRLQWFPPTPAKARTRRPHPGLRQLADATGGGYFELSAAGDLEATFARVAEELHRQYWLGFTPAERDGKTHKLEVRVRRSGLTVRARTDYLAAAP